MHHRFAVLIWVLRYTEAVQAGDAKVDGCETDDDCIKLCSASCVKQVIGTAVQTRCTCERSAVPGNCAVKSDVTLSKLVNQECIKDEDCKATCYASCQTGPNPDNYCVCVDDTSPGNCGKSDVEDRQKPEALSLDGKPFYAPKFEGLIAAGLKAQLEIAKFNLRDDACDHGHDPAKEAWLGRRLADLWRYSEAISSFSSALNHTPEDPMLHRHRGHRYITTRNFTKAEMDLSKAVDLIHGQRDGWEEAAAPNIYNLPLYTRKFNVFYHLGLAQYLKGDFQGALDAYTSLAKQIPSWGMTDESMQALSHWRYMALRRLGDPAAANESLAEIHAGMRVLDGTGYLNLTLLYKGERTPEDVLSRDAPPLDLATVGYGLGNWHWYNGRHSQAIALWQRVVNTTYWAAFGFIAAESELHRIGVGSRVQRYAANQLFL